MDEEFEREEGGVTLGYIFRMIFSQKWLALILAAIITVVGALGVFFFGKSRSEYQMSISVRYPDGGYNAQSFKFPDGTDFFYKDLVSEEYLLAAQTNKQNKYYNAEFANIDIAKMHNEGGIDITYDRQKIFDDSEEYETSFLLKAKAKYFKSQVIAMDYLRALMLEPGYYFVTAEKKYDANLLRSREALTYDIQLSYLNAQVFYLNDIYSRLIAYYGEDTVVDDNGGTLDDYKSQIDVFISNNTFTQLSNEVREKGYIKSANALVEYESQRFEKERERDILDKTYQALRAELNPDAQIDAIPTLRDLKERIVRLDRDLEEINNYINGHGFNKEFDDKIMAVDKKIEKFTADLTANVPNAYAKGTKVNFLDPNIVSETGSFNPVISIAIGLVAGIVIAMIVAYIVGWNKDKNSSSAQATSTPVTFGEAARQAAATDASADGDTKKQE